MRNKTIKFIATAILISMSFLVANAQEQTIVNTTEGSAEKVEKKETAKKQQSTNDSWTGFYVGGFGGYTNGRASANMSTADATDSPWSPTTIANVNNVGVQRIKSNGFNGGGTVGYNFQKGHFVVGGELDFGANRINGSTSTTGILFTGSQATVTVKQSVKSDWMMTARNRVGLANKKVLVYVTGGLALTNLKYAGNLTASNGTTESGSFSKNKIGWVAGGGIEIKMSRHWSVKSEYLFSQFDRTSATANNLTTNALGPVVRSNIFTHSTDLKSHSVRFGVNYRF